MPVYQPAAQIAKAEVHCDYDSIKSLHLELNQAYNLEDLMKYDNALQIYRSLINKAKALKDPIVKLLLLDQVYFYSAIILHFYFKNNNTVKNKNDFIGICKEWAAIQQSFPYAADANSYQQHIDKFVNPDCNSLTHLAALANRDALTDFYSDAYIKGLGEGNLLILQACRVAFVRLARLDLAIQCMEEVIKLDNFKKANPIIKANFYYNHVYTLVDMAKQNPNSENSIKLIEKAYQCLKLAKSFNKKTDPRTHALLLIDVIKANPSAKFNMELIEEAHACLKQASRGPEESECDENNMRGLKLLNRAAIAYEQAKHSGHLTAIQASSPGYVNLLLATKNENFAVNVLDETTKLQEKYQKEKLDCDTVASRENILRLATTYQQKQTAHVDPNNEQTKQAFADAKAAYKDALRVDIAKRAIKANLDLPLTRDGKYLDLATILVNSSKHAIHIEGRPKTPHSYDLRTSVPGSGSGSKFYKNYGDYDCDYDSGQEPNDDLERPASPSVRPG